MKRNFKVGQKIIFVKDISGHGFPINSVIELNHADNFENSYNAYRHGMTWWFNSEEFKPYEEYKTNSDAIQLLRRN